MANAQTYEKTFQKYKQMAEAAANGNTEAKRDKAKVRLECRQMEREFAREGVIAESGKIVKEGLPTKRSLQEEYTRRFDDDTVVRVDGKETTLRQYHAKRLLGK